MSFQVFFTSFVALFGVVKSFVFVYVLSLQHQQAASLMLVRGMLCSSTGAQREE
jgi:hypothetical protein